MKSLYINKRKAKAMMSNFTHKEHKVYEAHEARQPGFDEYVSVDKLNKYVEVLERIANGSLSAVDCEKLARGVLGER